MSLETDFPNLAGSGYAITSPKDREYNCIAWAAQDSSNWWEPDPFDLYYWPIGIEREYTLAAYEQVFVSLGYYPCKELEFEPGFEKIAIYVDSGGTPTHVARQTESGWWTSKLGGSEDIEHQSVEGLENSPYGTVVKVLKRPHRASD